MPRRQPLLVVATLALIAMTGGVRGQDSPILLTGVEQLEFDRPESWAMTYFGSIALPTGLGAPRRVAAGTVSLELEGGLVPNLGAEKRRVGFIGSKVEDLNRTNLFGRLRATVGLPRGIALTIGATPPLEINGVTPELVSLAIGVPLADRGRWRLGARLHGQSGTIAGDLTCPRNIAAVADPQRNPDDCRVASEDSMSVDSIGLELAVARMSSERRWRPYLALSVNRFDLAFQVRARYSTFLDRVRLETEGTTYSLSAGAEVDLSDSLALAAETFFSPLDVVRDPRRGARSEALVNARMLLRYRLGGDS